MTESEWSNGVVVEYDPEKRTGVIIQYDGAPIQFHISDVISGEPPQEGQMCLFRLEETRFGLTAKDIQVLGMEKSGYGY